MKTSSAKAKGRRLQQLIAQKISHIIGLPCGKDCPIESRPMGEAGTDVRLDQEARKLFPFSVETKCCEAWQIPAWIEQAKGNCYDGTDWLLICSKNRHKPVAVLDAEVLFGLLERVQRLKRRRGDTKTQDQKLQVS